MENSLILNAEQLKLLNHVIQKLRGPTTPYENVLFEPRTLTFSVVQKLEGKEARLSFKLVSIEP